jgi:Ciliary BBSome complex subunit 2, C-terminal
MILDLRQKKAEYTQEVHLLNQNLSGAQTAGNSVILHDVLPPDTDVSAVVQTDQAGQGLELVLSTNNECVIKGCVVFAEQMFDGESLFVHPEDPTSAMRIPVCPSKDTAVDMLVKVRTASSQTATSTCNLVGSKQHGPSGSKPSGC